MTVRAWRPQNLNQQLGSMNLGLGTGFKNAIINGNFDIWQRGTSFTSVSSLKYVTDRFFWAGGNTVVYTFSQSTTVPTVTQSGVLSNYSLKAAVTTAEASPPSTDYSAIFQSIEGYTWTRFAQQQFTLSFWVYANKTGTYCVSFRNSGGDRSYVATYTISSSNTWQKVSITVPASPSAGTWNYTNGIGLSVAWTQMSGTTYQTGSPNTWITGNFLSTSGAVNNCDSTSDTFYLSQVQLELGPQATNFEYRPYGVELQLCQRYCWRWTAGGNGEMIGPSHLRSTTAADTEVRFPVPMRTAPTFTFSSGSTDFDEAYGGNDITGDNLSAPVAGSVYGQCVRFTAGSAVFTAGQAGTLSFNSASAWIQFDAEL